MYNGGGKSSTAEKLLHTTSLFAIIPLKLKRKRVADMYCNPF